MSRHRRRVGPSEPIGRPSISLASSYGTGGSASTSTVMISRQFSSSRAKAARTIAALLVGDERPGVLTVVADERVEQVADAPGRRPRLGQREVLTAAMPQDLADLVAGRRRQPARQLLGLPDRAQPLGEAEPCRGEGVVADLAVVGHHVDRLPHDTVEPADEGVPGGTLDRRARAATSDGRGSSGENRCSLAMPPTLRRSEPAAVMSGPCLPQMSADRPPDTSDPTRISSGLRRETRPSAGD